MVHTTNRSPLSATIAVIAAGAIVLATTTIAPPTTSAALTAPPISTQTVDLTAVAGPLPAADLSAGLTNTGDVLQHLPTAITQGVKNVLLAPVAGAAAGIFLGFFGGGVLAGNLLRWVPDKFAAAITPVIWTVGVVGALVGAPIGAVAGPIIAAASWLSRIRSQHNAIAPASPSVPAAGRATNKAHRSLATPSAARASKGSVPQRLSKTARNGTGHARNAASNSAARS